jgi:hypothetical protein
MPRDMITHLVFISELRFLGVYLVSVSFNRSRDSLQAKGIPATPFPGLALHLLRDLDVDVEEFGDAAVDADGLGLVQVGFAVVVGDALSGAGLGQSAGERETR